MKISTKLKLSAAAVAMAIAGNANAALTVSDSVNGNGSLFLTVFDSVLGVGYVRDLGTTLQGFLSVISWDPAAGDLTSGGGVLFSNAGDQLFADTFAGSSATNIQWNISASDASSTAGGVIGTSDTPHVQRFLTTEQAGKVTTGTALNVNNNQINNITLSKIVNFATAVNASCGFSGASCATDSSETGTAYYPGRAAVWGDDFGTAIAAFDNTQSQLNPMDFFYLTHAGTSGTSQSLKFAAGNENGRGQWTLSATGGVQFAAPEVSAVPVPAAVWLLGSALVGLGTTARRRTQA
jgi:hypothetical protein